MRSVLKKNKEKGFLRLTLVLSILSAIIVFIWHYSFYYDSFYGVYEHDVVNAFGLALEWFIAIWIAYVIARWIIPPIVKWIIRGFKKSQ